MGYAYLGYPALLRFLAWSFPLPPPRLSPDWQPSVSVVLACAGETGLVESRVANALAQTHGALEVILVMDGVPLGPDVRARLGEHGDRVRVVQLASSVGKTEAQSRGVAGARGEGLVCSDLSAAFEPGAVAALVAPLADREVSATSGELVYSGCAPETLYRRFECWLKRHESVFSGALGATGPIYAVRRSQYVPLPPHALSDLVGPLVVGLFHGGRVHCVPEAVATEPLPSTPGALLGAKRRIAVRALSALPTLMPCLDVVRRPRLALAFFSHKLLRWASWLMALMAVAGLLGMGLPGWLLGVALVVAVVGRVRPGCWPADVAAYVMGMAISQVGAVVDLIRGVRIAAWKPTHRENIPP
ncbi:MAG: glycosyltransferase [Candidatus Riflebacteria bacterium]|nr:glycosyltransferase [Candidatus Riflebacteria bacterium]